LPTMVQLKLSHRDPLGFGSGHSCSMDSSFRIVLLDIAYYQFGPNLYSCHDCFRSSLKTYPRKNFILHLLFISGLPKQLFELIGCRPAVATVT